MPVIGRARRPHGRLIAMLAVLTLACGTEPAAPGSRIAFLGFLPETVSLFSMESDGRDVRRLSDTTLLAGLEGMGAAVKVELKKPGVKIVTMTIRWKNGVREARLELVRVDTGGSNLW